MKSKAINDMSNVIKAILLRSNIISISKIQRSKQHYELKLDVYILNQQRLSTAMVLRLADKTLRQSANTVKNQGYKAKYPCF